MNHKYLKKEPDAQSQDLLRQLDSCNKKQAPRRCAGVM